MKRFIGIVLYFCSLQISTCPLICVLRRPLCYFRQHPVVIKWNNGFNYLLTLSEFRHTRRETIKLYIILCISDRNRMILSSIWSLWTCICFELCNAQEKATCEIIAYTVSVLSGNRFYLLVKNNGTNSLSICLRCDITKEMSRYTYHYFLD